MNQHNLSRFHSKYIVNDENGCWEWLGTLNACGYGIFVMGHAKGFLAHRVIYEHLHGPIQPRECVCHRCDNRKCVNPSHLWKGTHIENMRDMISKGRMKPPPRRIGENSSQAKLSNKDVMDIRSRYSPRVVTYKILANEYRVSEALISKIVNRQLWCHL